MLHIFITVYTWKSALRKLAISAEVSTYLVGTISKKTVYILD